MTAESDNIVQSLDDQLSTLDNKLDASSGDVEMLADIQQGIGRLVAENGSNEGEIRRVLQDRYDKGNLRKETYQLVKSMLDQFVIGDDAKGAAANNDDAIGAAANNDDAIGAAANNDEALSLVEPDAPGKADEALSLVEPDAPGKADEPLSLVKPDEPEKPVKPPPAAKRKKAAKAKKSATSDKPVEPLSLVEPDEPAKPVKPPVPATIDKPDTPAESISLVEPEKSVKPGEPAAEVEPDELDATAIIPNEMLRPPTADDRVQAGSLLRDRFLLQERVSGGSMGVVFRAMDRRLAEATVKNPWVAINVLSPQLSKNSGALRALQQEAARGRCLSHPGIVRCLDLDRDDDLYFIVTEWLVGRTLADIIDSPDAKNIGPERAVEIASEVGEALEYAHSCGIVHADLRPGNVMILATGEARVFDFGIARVLKAQTDENTVDPAILSTFTPEYSSMQVLTGEKPVPSDDVFSLGCLLYRLIAGYRVFGPRDAAEAANDGMKPQRLKGIPKYQWAAIKKAISYARVTRFVSMAEFLDALKDPSLQKITIHPDEIVPVDNKRGSPTGLLGLLALLLILAGGEYQFGLSNLVRTYLNPEPPVSEAVVTTPVVTRSDDMQAEALMEIAAPFGDDGTGTTPAGDAVKTSPADDAVEAVTVDDSIAQKESSGVDATLPEVIVNDDPIAPAIDFSSLPPADFELSLSSYGATGTSLALTIREDGAAVVIDLVRFNEIDRPMELRIEEIGYSGNRSPWATGQLEISNDGFVSILAGQDRARVTLGMAKDPLREADQQVTLLVRNSDSTDAELARIELVLEDDDQRAFETRLPRDTVAFAVSQIAVGEQDPAAQIDIMRFNPGNRSIEIAYTVSDVTATEGEDYFSPGSDTISFGPGQRSARLLIPLVQDAVVEGDEALSVRLITSNPGAGADVFQRIVVMIRDDDAPVR